PLISTLFPYTTLFRSISCPSYATGTGLLIFTALDPTHGLQTKISLNNSWCVRRSISKKRSPRIYMRVSTPTSNTLSSRIANPAAYLIGQTLLDRRADVTWHSAYQPFLTPGIIRPIRLQACTPG